MGDKRVAEGIPPRCSTCRERGRSLGIRPPCESTLTHTGRLFIGLVLKGRVGSLSKSASGPSGSVSASLPALPPHPSFLTWKSKTQRAQIRACASGSVGAGWAVMRHEGRLSSAVRVGTASKADITISNVMITYLVQLYGRRRVEVGVGNGLNIISHHTLVHVTRLSL